MDVNEGQEQAIASAGKGTCWEGQKDCWLTNLTSKYRITEKKFLKLACRSTNQQYKIKEFPTCLADLTTASELSPATA